MTACSPQRYLANNRNLVRTADLTASSVLPVAGLVLEVPVARDGSGQVILAGTYTGAEPATYDIEITDDTPDSPVITAVIASGKGSGVLSDIVATGSPQTFTVELGNDGTPLLSAGVDFEGVRIVARASGAVGNALYLEIDQSALVFTPQAFSLLADLPVGAGGVNNGLLGAAFDWDAKVLSANNIIPANAHRVSFGDDRSNIYLQYKQYVAGEWNYHFVPAIKREVPKGTVVNFVTGGRTVDVNDGTSPPPLETYTAIVTVYDLLNALKTSSSYLDVVGVVAYDRSPTGQAAKEILLRTDAHCEPSSGTGSKYATGFVDAFANPNAATETVEAECFAISTRDHPLARVGAERWHLRGSVSGDLGDIVTAVPFVDPGAKFGLTIPQKLPESYGAHVGRFDVVAINYVGRDFAEKPPICVVAKTLGSEAVDQTITLVWTQRPTDCLCAAMPVPKLSPFCLGLFDTEGATLSYQPDTIERLRLLYEWYKDEVRTRSAYLSITQFQYGAEEHALTQPATGIAVTPGTGNAGVTPGDVYTPRPGGDGNVSINAQAQSILESMRDIVSDFETALAAIDVVTDTALRDEGCYAWDAAVSQFEYDIDGISDPLLNIATERYKSHINLALITAGISPLGKSDASTIESGDGCWRDLGGDYWTVVGSDKGAYAPAFNNTPYYSSRLASNGKQYFSTKEFGLQINIKCPEKLVFGDEIVLVIGDAGSPSTYQLGDKLALPIVAGQPLQLAGGQDGSAILDFYVSGSVSGAFPNFVYDPGAPTSYILSGLLEFDYTPGGIPNVKGDRWTFALEGGHWRWRKDGGAWNLGSPPYEIDATSQFFDSGLTIQFVAGATPSFVPGDFYSFRALQPWAVSNLQSPNRQRWQWDGAAATLLIDLGSPQPISNIAIARHTLPVGATVLFEGGTSPGVYPWSQSLTWRADVMASEFTEETARYVLVTLGSAAGGGIGWLYVGQALTTSLSAEIALRRVYKMDSGSAGIDQGGRYLGRGRAGFIKWTEAALSDTDVTGINDLLDWLKMHGDEPFVLIPQIERPDEAFAVMAAVDDVDFVELSDYNRDPAYERRYSIDLPFNAVFRR